MFKDEAIELFDRSPRKLAEALGLSVQAVNQWNNPIPEARAEQIRELKGLDK